MENGKILGSQRVFIYTAQNAFRVSASLLSEVFILKSILLVLLTLILLIPMPALGEEVPWAETPAPGHRNVPVSEYTYTTATYKDWAFAFTIHRTGNTFPAMLRYASANPLRMAMHRGVLPSRSSSSVAEPRAKKWKVKFKATSQR